MNNDVLLNNITFTFDNADEDCRPLVEEFLSALEKGQCRAALPSPTGFRVDERVKKGILLAFRIGKKEVKNLGPLSFIDKDTLWPRSFNLNDEVRIVPGGVSIRRGVYLGKNVIVMPPSYINIGAFVDDGSLIDSNALVGSCAQVGKNVHLSAGVQLGGVLEPVGASPVIVEDDVLIGGSSALYEGIQVGKKAVIGAGVVLTKSSKVFDLVNEKIITAGDDVLKIPAFAVVVQGARTLTSDFAQSYGLSISTPLIIKYRDGNTDKKTVLEDLLR